MKKTPRFSIITPVYNAEKFLHDCVESVLAQDSDAPYEMILVDDASSDSSGNIIDLYATQYSQIVAIHQSNQGPAGARNTGLAVATGEYVLFLDSDDRWHPQMLSAMDTVSGETPDMVMFFYEEDRGENRKMREPPKVCPEGESGREWLSKLFERGGIPTFAVWSYMYRRAFLVENNLKFSQHLKTAEDSSFNCDAITAAKKILCIAQPLYIYRILGNSLSHTPTLKKEFGEIEALAKWFQKYPFSVWANAYASRGALISTLGSKKETRELVNQYAQHAEVLSHVSTPGMRIARALFFSFGYYYGSKLFLSILRIYQWIRH